MKKFLTAAVLFLAPAVPAWAVDVAITAANVVKGTGATVYQGTAGATITAGQVCYVDSSGLVQLAKANGTAAQKAVIGIALCSASANQPITLQTGGQITIGGTVVAGTAYYLSGNNAGGIAPAADVGAGYRVILLGIATTSGILNLNIFDSTAQL